MPRNDNKKNISADQEEQSMSEEIPDQPPRVFLQEPYLPDHSHSTPQSDPGCYPTSYTYSSRIR